MLNNLNLLITEALSDDIKRLSKDLADIEAVRKLRYKTYQTTQTVKDKAEIIGQATKQKSKEIAKQGVLSTVDNKVTSGALGQGFAQFGIPPEFADSVTSSLSGGLSKSMDAISKGVDSLKSKDQDAEKNKEELKKENELNKKRQLLGRVYKAKLKITDRNGVDRQGAIQGKALSKGDMEELVKTKWDKSYKDQDDYYGSTYSILDIEKLEN